MQVTKRSSLVCSELDFYQSRLTIVPHIWHIYLSRLMGIPTICIGENKGTDQLRSNCEADRRLCFRYTDSSIPLLSKSKISSFYPSYVTVQVGLCWTWSKTTLLVFPRGGSFHEHLNGHYSSDCCQFVV